MSTTLKLRRGTTAQHSSFTGAAGEVTVDTDKKTVVVHDGTTAGGFPAASAVNPSFSGDASFSANGSFAGNLTLNNGNADGAQLSLASSGYSNWNIDNYSGRLRAYYGSTEYFTVNSSGNVGIGTSSNLVFDNVAQPRPLVVQSSSSTTTPGSSTNSITVCNSDTTANNVSQINFAAITGSNTNQFSSAWIAAVHGTRVDGQYPTGQLIFATSSATNSAPSEKMRIDSSGIVTGTAGNLMLVSGTSVSASGTSVEFTSIPSWVKRITLQLAGISTNGTSPYMVQIGSGSFTTSGYSSQSWASTGGGVVTSGFSITPTAQAALIYTGQIVLTKYTSNNWISSGIVGITSTTSNAYQSSGYSSDLGAALDRVRITTVGGTNTFDAGTINILYE